MVCTECTNSHVYSHSLGHGYLIRKKLRMRRYMYTKGIDASKMMYS